MRFATCHPDRKHAARGWCAQCYTNAKQRKGFVKTGRIRKPTTCGHDGRNAGNGLCQACYSREHRNRNPEKRYEWALRAKLAVYGITPEIFRSMLEAQKDLCALCGGAFKSNRDMQVDHCHATGRVRGVLCFTCNKGLGMLGDNEDGLLRALAYLRSGAAQNGIHIPDPDPFWREQREAA